MNIYLVSCAKVICREIEQGLTQKQIADTYAMAIRSESAGADAPDWGAINRAIMAPARLCVAVLREHVRLCCPMPARGTYGRPPSHVGAQRGGSMMRWRARRKARTQLLEFWAQGVWVAHLPAFLDREPRSDLHRAERAAFMRGFLREQEAMRCATPARGGEHVDVRATARREALEKAREKLIEAGDDVSPASDYESGYAAGFYKASEIVRALLDKVPS